MHLDKVKSVTYIPPQRFTHPEQVSEEASNNFEIWVLTWRRFNGIAMIMTGSGQSFYKQYQIASKDKVEASRRRGIPFVQKCN